MSEVGSVAGGCSDSVTLLIVKVSSAKSTSFMRADSTVLTKGARSDHEFATRPS